MRTDMSRVDQAIELRKAGLSIKSIAKELSAAQSSVSIWTRDVILTQSQQATLRSNTHSTEAIEKRRLSRLANEQIKRDLVIDSAAQGIGPISERELLLICTALYWAEGSKKRGAIQFANGDPRMIRIMLYFLREVCHVEDRKLRCHIHIHESLNPLQAERYWREITKISPEQFYKTYNKPNKSSKGKRNSLPYGVCNIYVLDTKLFLKIQGWTKGIYESLVN